MAVPEVTTPLKIFISPFSQSNLPKYSLALVAGSGFGGLNDTQPYLTGDWSKQFSVEPMPFDGILFASRIMVANEAHRVQLTLRQGSRNLLTMPCKTRIPVCTGTVFR